MGTLEIIFLILIFVFSLGEIIRFDLVNGLFIKAVDTVAIFLVLIYLIKNIKIIKFNQLFKVKFTFPIFLFFIVGLISLVINFGSLKINEFFFSLSYLLRWVLYAGVYFVVNGFSLRFKNKIIYLLIISGGLLVLFGFIQYFFYASLGNLFYLGWDEHMYRLFSTFLDPNFVGAFYVLYLIFILGFFSYYLKNKKNILAVFAFFTILVLTMSSIYLTFSRSALIMLFVSIFSFSMLTKKIKLFFGLIAISLLVIFISSKNFYIENINLFRTFSSNERLKSAKDAIVIIEKKPILGIGFNSYRYAQVRYNLRSHENAFNKYSHADAGTDNSFLFVLATTGIIGFGAYLYLLYKMIKYSFVKYKTSKKYSFDYFLSVIVISSFAGIIVDSMFINSLFYSFIMIWIWIIVGLFGSDRRY